MKTKMAQVKAILGTMTRPRDLAEVIVAASAKLRRALKSHDKGVRVRARRRASR